MQVLIIGAGAVGGYVGSKLLSAGADVEFLARGRRLETLTRQGLIVESSLGNFSAPVKTARVPLHGHSPDLVIIACKAPALDGALDEIHPIVGTETRILSFLNGVAHLETMRRNFPSGVHLAGVAHGALTLRETGVIEHLTPFFSTIVGSVSSPQDPVAQELVTLFDKAEVDVRLSHDIYQDLWNKFVFLTTLAGATCLMRASIGTILRHANGEGLVIQLLDECLAVACAEGFAPDGASMLAYRRTLTERGSTLTSSMLRDIQSGRHTEADHIVGDMVRRAERHGIATPLLRIADVHLQCFEASVRSAR